MHTKHESSGSQDAAKAYTACLTHLPRPARSSTAARSIRTEGPREYVEPSGSILWGGQAAPKTPTHLTLRPGKKSYQLALDVSSRRAADRSPTEQDGRRAESIGINSTMVGDNMQAVRTTPG